MTSRFVLAVAVVSCGGTGEEPRHYDRGGDMGGGDGDATSEPDPALQAMQDAWAGTACFPGEEITAAEASNLAAACTDEEIATITATGECVDEHSDCDLDELEVGECPQAGIGFACHEVFVGARDPE